MPQLAAQLAQWLAAEHAAGRVHDDRGRTEIQVQATRDHLAAAARAADQLTTHLQQAQNAASGLAYRGGGSDE